MTTPERAPAAQTEPERPWWLPDRGRAAFSKPRPAAAPPAPANLSADLGEEDDEEEDGLSSPPPPVRSQVPWRTPGRSRWSPPSVSWRRPAGPMRFWETNLMPAACLAVGLLAVGGYLTVQPLLGGGTADSAPVLTAAKARLVYEPNAVHRFFVSQKLTALLVLPDGEYVKTYSDIQATEAFRVISVARDGTATMGLKLEKLGGDFDGVAVPFNATRAKEIILVVSPDGRIVSGGTGGTLGGSSVTQDPGSDQFASILPARSVKVGDTWGRSFTRPNPMGSGQMRYSTTNQLLRMDGIDGQQAAVIQTDYTLPIDMLLNLRQLAQWTGDSTAGIPAAATVSYAGSSTGSIVGYFGVDSQQLLHAVDTSDFQFDVTFNGLPNTAAYKALSGKFHFGGHLEADLQSLDGSTRAAA